MSNSEDTLIEEYFLARFNEIFGQKKKRTRMRAITVLCSIAVEASHDGSAEAEDVYNRCRNYVLNKDWRE